MLLLLLLLLLLKIRDFISLSSSCLHITSGIQYYEYICDTALFLYYYIIIINTYKSELTLQVPLWSISIYLWDFWFFFLLKHNTQYKPQVAGKNTIILSYWHHNYSAKKKWRREIKKIYEPTTSIIQCRVIPNWKKLCTYFTQYIQEEG